MGDSGNPHAMGNKILKNAGLTPEWIERKKMITTRTEDIRTSIGALSARNATLEEAEIKKEIAAVNKLIDDYNLTVPVLSQQRVRLRWEKERDKVKGRQ